MKTSVRIKSKSHKINTESFLLFERLKSNFKVEIINENTFTLIWDLPENSNFLNENHDHHCSLVFSTMLAAINIASLGLFSWHDGTDIGPIYVRDASGNEASSLITMSANHHQKYESLRPLIERDIHDSLILFGALCRETERIVVVEYLKGVMHLCMTYYDINFHREAFGNFYRVIEYVVTNRVLRRKKLRNELQEIQQEFRDFGADEAFVSEFKYVYTKRSSQIMHAQIQPESISFDDAIVAKAFCDLLLNKYYRGIAESQRKNKSNI